MQLQVSFSTRTTINLGLALVSYVFVGRICRFRTLKQLKAFSTGQSLPSDFPTSSESDVAADILQRLVAARRTISIVGPPTAPSDIA